ncbi:MAG: hypothetical protein HYX24_03975 [Candidatus Aenigmarchaeota archaeon]|nr:hypothetical protein [Candidatus Aenigmarchaeota archaeon]
MNDHKQKSPYSADMSGHFLQRDEMTLASYRMAYAARYGLRIDQVLQKESEWLERRPEGEDGIEYLIRMHESDKKTSRHVV